MAYLVVMMGALQGSAVAYEAQNKSATEIDYNGSHVTIGHQPPKNLTLNFTEQEKSGWEKRLDSVVPGETRSDGPVNDAVESLARQMAHGAFIAAFGTADLVAGFVYQNQWIPKPLLQGLFQVMGYGAVLAVMVLQLARFRRFA